MTNKNGTVDSTIDNPPMKHDKKEHNHQTWWTCGSLMIKRIVIFHRYFYSGIDGDVSCGLDGNIYFIYLYLSILDIWMWLKMDEHGVMAILVVNIVVAVTIHIGGVLYLAYFSMIRSILLWPVGFSAEKNGFVHSSPEFRLRVLWGEN